MRCRRRCAMQSKSAGHDERRNWPYMPSAGFRSLCDHKTRLLQFAPFRLIVYSFRGSAAPASGIQYMKRKSSAGSGARLGDILEATTIEQRAWIGAVALAYNDAESVLHRVVGACFNCGGSFCAVTSRINGTDGLIEIILEAATSMGLPEATIKLFKGTLLENGFGYLKGLRDAVIHAQLFDSGSGLAVSQVKRGKSQNEVLLTPEALEGLYRRLVLVDRELLAIEMIVRCETAIRLLRAFGALDDQRRQYNEQDIQDAVGRCQSHQRQRLTLPPFPEFPEPPEVDQLVHSWLTSQSPTKTLKVRVKDQG